LECVSGSEYDSSYVNMYMIGNVNRIGTVNMYSSLFKCKIRNYILKKIFNQLQNCDRMMEEVTESEFRELANNPTRERPLDMEQPVLLVEDDESLLDMEEEEEDEVMLLKRAIADAPSGDVAATDAAADDGVSASPPPVAAPAAAAAVNTPDTASDEKERVNPQQHQQYKVNDSNPENLSDTQSGYFASSSETGESSFFNYSKYGTRSRIGEGEKYIGSEKPPMSSNYYQCKAARGANMSHITYKVGLGPDAGTCEQVSYQRLGSFECQGDTEILKTFRGSRITRNGETVIQNISSTFDPANLKCVVCEKPHYILAKGPKDLRQSFSFRIRILFLPCRAEIAALPLYA
jgi:hypothetical protein